MMNLPGQPQPIFVGMPYGGYGQPAMSGQQGLMPLTVPPRVETAVELLQFFAVKQMERCVANEVGFERIPGQQLTTEELSLQATSANVVERYLAGKLPDDVWESPRLAQMHQAAKPPPRSRKKEEKKSLARVTLSPCMVCGGQTGRPCTICHGEGHIAVMPRSAAL